MIYYRITMQTGFALAVDQNHPEEGGQLILDKPANNDFQLWDMAFLPNAGWNVGVALINKATGMMATFDATGNGTSVVQRSVPAGGAIGNSQAWQTNAIAPVTAPTIRTLMPLLAEDQCLNASGNAPWGYQTPIIVWQWAGGQPNELWSFTPVEI